MKVEVESIGSYQRKLTVSIPSTTVKNELDSAFKTMARRARLPGFRQGKVPRRVLEARFGDGVREDVASTLVQRGYVDALAAQSIEPVGRVNLTETPVLPRSGDFTFTVMVEVKPEFELTKTTGVDVVYPKVEVTDAEIDLQVRRQLEGRARLVEVTDRAVQRGDMVMVELEVKDGDEVVATEPGTMIRTEADPYYPGVEAFLEGLETGGSKEGEVSFAADAKTEAVAGRTLAVRANVLSIQANQVPELTDAIAEELGFEGGAAGMRQKLRDDIASGRDELARNQARANLLEALIAANPFEVPEGMIDNSLEMLMDALREQQRSLGRDPRSLSFGQAQIADLRMRATFAAKAGLILEKVNEQNGIEVSDDEVEAKIEAIAEQRGWPLEALKAHYAQPDQRAELKAQVLEEKTLDWLLERANVVEPAPVDADTDAPAAAEADAAPAVADAPAADGADDEADLSVLKGAVAAVKQAVESGEHDAHLAALLAAEESGKARKGALAAIQKRIDELG